MTAIEHRLAGQFRAVRTVIAPNAAILRNTHYTIGDQLNALLALCLEKVTDVEIRSLLHKIAPLKFEHPKGAGEYTVDSQQALILCDSLISLLESAPETSVSPRRVRVQSSIAQSEIKGDHSVFLIHGHDYSNALRLRDLLASRFKLNPIILSYEAEKGRTVIEKFEQVARRCTYAFAIMTPDDTVVTSAGNARQSRPNVIFELGWFYGKLGRDRVCILFKKGTEIHSDLNGILRLEFIESVSEKIAEIERELTVAEVL